MWTKVIISTAIFVLRKILEEINRKKENSVGRPTKKAPGSSHITVKKRLKYRMQPKSKGVFGKKRFLRGDTRFDGFWKGEEKSCF